MDRLIALDERLFVVGEIPVERPLSIAATSDGGVWVRSLREGGGERLFLYSARGELTVEVGLGELLDLERDDADRAVVLEMGRGSGSRTLWRVDSAGERLELDGISSGDFLACREGLVAVGSSCGVLRVLDSAGRELASRDLASPLGALAAAPGPAFWAIVLGEKPLVLLLDQDLKSINPRAGPPSSWEPETGPLPLAAAGDGAAWTVGPQANEVRRLGPQARVFSGFASLPPSCPVVDIAALGSRDLVVAAPGALVAVEPFGDAWRVGRVQGGFGYLSDIEPVPRTLARVNPEP